MSGVFDLETGVVVLMEASTAKAHDSDKFMSLHGDEHAASGDKGYVSGEREELFRKQGKVWAATREGTQGLVGGTPSTKTSMA